MMRSNLKIALVAGELSGDILGSDLILQIKQRYPHAEIIGIGGTKMAQAGQKQWYDYSVLSLIGLFEVLKSLNAILKLRKKLYKRLLAESIDLFIGIDVPDFNFPLEKNLKKQGVKVVHYVSPSVWAWRKERIYKIADSCDHLLCLFPFEPFYYADTGLECSFVTHPMAKQIPMEPFQTNLIEKNHQLDAKNKSCGVKSIGVLPGSRLAEVERNLPVQLATILCLKNQYQSNLKIMVPIASEGLRASVEHIIDKKFEFLKNSIYLFDSQARAVMQASDVLLLASGTIALEAMLLKKPMVVMYIINPLSAWLVERRLQTPWVSLPNALAGEFIVPEYLQRFAKPTKMAKEMHQLLTDDAIRGKQIESFTETHQSLISKKQAIDVISKMLNPKE